jgi:hypothetical protein
MMLRSLDLNGSARNDHVTANRGEVRPQHSNSQKRQHCPKCLCNDEPANEAGAMPATYPRGFAPA